MNIHHKKQIKTDLNLLASVHEEISLSHYLKCTDDNKASCIAHAGFARARKLIKTFQDVDTARLSAVYRLSTNDEIAKNIQINDVLHFGFATYELLIMPDEEQGLLKEFKQLTIKTLGIFIAKAPERDKATAIALWTIFKIALDF